MPEIDPSTLAPVERYKLLVGAVVPRPIAWVSTISPTGHVNLAPFSFFNALSANPMTLLFCPANNADGSAKHTLLNVEATGEFVVNVVTEAQARRMSVTAEELPAPESEFELAGLDQAPSARVTPPRVAGAPVHFECVVFDVLRLAPGEPAGGNVVIGRVVHVHAEADVIDERMRIDPERLAAVGRMAGLGYCTTRDRFDLPWGRAALEGA